MRKYLAEFGGTAALVLIGCGSVVVGGLGGVLSGGQPIAPLAVLPIAFAFGLTVTAMAYAVGPISGGHFNPAVTVGLWAAGRFKSSEIVPYVVAQVLGAVAGAALLVLILSSKVTPYDLASGLGQNGWDPVGPAGYGATAAFIVEVVATFLFVSAILGATSPTGAGAAAGLIIGLTLVVLHLPFVNVTGFSVNPARSIGPALFVGGKAIPQLWLFILAPLVGGWLAGALAKLGNEAGDGAAKV